MAGKRKYLRIGALKSALSKHMAIVSRSAKELGITRQTLAIRIAGSDELQRHVREVKEATLDLGESVIMQAIKKKDLPTTRWYLERQGKTRGYASKSEIDTRVSDEQLEAIIAAFGGDADKLRAFRSAIDPSATIQ